MKLHQPLLAGLLALITLMSGCATDSHPSAGADSRAATKILKRWVEVSGGKSAFRKIEGVQSQAAMDFGPLVPDVIVDSSAMVGGRFRYEMTSPAFGKIITASDGKNVWQENDKLGFGLMKPKEAMDMMRDSDPQEEANFDRYYPIRHRLPDASVNGQQFQVIAVTTPEGVTEKWFMDPATGLRLRAEKPDNTVEYSDFRRLGDFMFPYVTKHSGKSGPVTIRMKSLVLNPKLNPADYIADPKKLEDAVTVARILDRYCESAGGERLAKIQTRVTHLTMIMPKTGTTADMKITQKRPHFVLIEQTVPGMGWMVQGFDGKTGWANSEMQGYRVLKGPELQQLLSNADLDAEANVAAQCPLRKLLGERMVGDLHTQAVELAGFRGSNGTYYFDEASGHLVRVESSLIAGPKSVIQAKMDLSDYREVDGVSVAYKTIVDNPAFYFTMTVSAVEQNVPVDDAVFKPRQDD